MERYQFEQAAGRLTFIRAGGEPSETCHVIYLVSFEEFCALKNRLPRKNNFLHSMSPIQYCKIEKYTGCIQGTMRVPKGNKGQIGIHNFGFYLAEKELYLVEESHFLMELLNKMSEGVYEHYSLSQILLALFEQLLQDDVLYLQKQEEHLAGLEEELLKKIPEHFYEIIIKYRKRFTIFHAYYEQLMNMGDVMQTSVNLDLKQEEKAQWQLFSGRAERLHDHVEMLREYLVQIRELYQSLIDVQQNKVMGILTIVTTIFLPLTLIAGWYGMNFPNMPEFGWKYAYPAVIIVSVTVIVLEIIYFKKKKMF